MERGSSSIAYERSDAALRNAVVLFNYPRAREAPAELADAERWVLQEHPGARLASEKTLALVKRKNTHEAFVATIELEGTFQDEQQPLSAQILVIALPRRFVQVRSTAPLAQGALAEQSLLELLAELRWDEDPR